MAPANGAPICVDGICGVRCDGGRALCAGACARCPVEGVATTTCDGAACVPRACEDDHRLCGGACAPCPTERVLETVCAGDRCVASRCAPDTHPCAEGCCFWRLAPVGVADANHALAVGEDGAHLAIGDGRTVRHGWWDGEVWDFEDVAMLDAAPQNDPDVAIAVDGETVHLVYTAIFPPPPGGSAPGVLRYLRRDADGWRDVGGIGGAGNNAPSAPSLALAGRVPWLAYQAASVQLVSPAARFDPASVTVAASWDPHLVIADGVMHLAWWYLGIRDRLGYASGAIGAPVEADPQAPDTGLTPRVTIDRDGLPVILHRSNDGRVFVTRLDAEGVWRTVELFVGIRLTTAFDLSTAPDGTLLGCISTPERIYLLRYDGASWIRERIADGGASTCEIAFGPDGSLHLVFGRAGGIDYVY
ncbi:MAG: hypothetical protein R3F65_01085 [bacterium]